MKENRLVRTFSSLKEKGMKAFVPFTLLGYPDRKLCLESIDALIEGGASALELGIAFSDPLADGPVIQAASHQVLSRGFSVEDSFSLIREIRSCHKDIPINILTYFNLALARGTDVFFKQLKEAGADGITFVDLPIEEIDEIYSQLKTAQLIPVMLISPLTPEERTRIILQYAEGFIYMVSRAGITGMHESFEANLKESIKTLQKLSSLPVLTGFGISTRENAGKIIDLGADGVIVGSKIIDLITRSSPSELRKVLIEYEQEIQEAINSRKEVKQKSIAVLR